MATPILAFVVVGLSLWLALSERSRRRLLTSQENILRAACKVRDSLLRTRLAIQDHPAAKHEAAGEMVLSDFIAEMLDELQKYVEAQLRQSQTSDMANARSNSL